jgi:hypothetical protein
MSLTVHQLTCVCSLLVIWHLATHNRESVQKAKKPGPTVDEDEATLQLIRMVLLYMRGTNTLLPITIAAKKRLQALLGIRTMETKEKRCYWQLPDNISMHLERCGIDRATGVCTDRAKFDLALLELEHAKAAKLEAKYAGQDLEARSAAINEAMQTYRPTKRPKTASPRHYLENHVINSKIASHLRRAQAEEEMDNYSPTPVKETTIRKKICGPWNPGEPNGLTL